MPREEEFRQDWDQSGAGDDASTHGESDVVEQDDNGLDWTGQEDEDTASA